MRTTTPISSPFPGSAAQLNDSVSAMPAHPTRTFAPPRHPGTAATLLTLAGFRASRQRHTDILILVAMMASLLCGCRSHSGASEAKRNALPAEAMKVLDKCDHFFLFSLDPLLPSMFAEPTSPAPEDFHGYRILGKTEVRERAERAHLLRELYSGIAQAGIDAQKCFNPRHGIRATSGGSNVDLLICFECFQIQTFPELDYILLTARFPESAFNRALERAGLPIATYGDTNRPPNLFE